MTDPHTEARKALAEITAIEGAANGPWRLSEVWRHPVGYGPHNDLNHEGKVFWGYSLSCSSEHGGHISPTMGMIYNFPDKTLSNAQHIAACDPATMQAIAALVDAQDAQIAALRSAGVHLLSRIDDWEADGIDGFGKREWHGHVVPAIERLDIAIRAMGGKADE